MQSIDSLITSEVLIRVVNFLSYVVSQSSLAHFHRGWVIGISTLVLCSWDFFMRIFERLWQAALDTLDPWRRKLQSLMCIAWPLLSTLWLLLEDELPLLLRRVATSAMELRMLRCLNGLTTSSWGDSVSTVFVCALVLVSRVFEGHTPGSWIPSIFHCTAIVRWARCIVVIAEKAWIIPNVCLLPDAARRWPRSVSGRMLAWRASWFPVELLIGHRNLFLEGQHVAWEANRLHLDRTTALFALLVIHSLRFLLLMREMIHL